MSRIAKAGVHVPSGVDVDFRQDTLFIKGSKGSFEYAIPENVQYERTENIFYFTPVDEKSGWALSGTLTAITRNMVTGVSQGFEKKLELVGVGYRAQAQGGKQVNLSLGFSHPIEYVAPEGVTIETPTQTEIVVKGYDNQKVGQVAADIRSFRPPEPYKGKGVKYHDERIVRKEAKKK